MTRVIIQPSYGSRVARQHWADTLDQERPFDIPPLRPLLTEQQHAALMRQHPSGRARFWGATATHDSRMDTLSLGDVVLFTGGKRVRAVGEVGVSFRNRAFADALWKPDPDRGSWHNVYSLLDFQPTDIPYEEIWALEGFTEGDNFMRLRFLDDEKSAVILSGLRITTSAELAAQAAAEAGLAAAFEAKGKLVPPEAVNVGSTSYDITTRHVLVNRSEALLVESYRQSLPAQLTPQRLRTRVGVTDLYITGPDFVEIVEAKAGATHRHVRQALGQLLDYAAHSPTRPTKLTALFPDRPSEPDIALLRLYGIDCVHRLHDGSWDRASARSDRLPRILDFQDDGSYSPELAALGGGADPPSSASCDVFISSGPATRFEAAQLSQELEKNGQRVFLSEKLQRGSEGLSLMQRALKEANTYVVLLSETPPGKFHAEELAALSAIARVKRAAVIPVLVGDAVLPASLREWQSDDRDRPPGRWSRRAQCRTPAGT